MTEILLDGPGAYGGTKLTLPEDFAAPRYRTSESDACGVTERVWEWTGLFEGPALVYTQVSEELVKLPYEERRRK